MNTAIHPDDNIDDVMAREFNGSVVRVAYPAYWFGRSEIMETTVTFPVVLLAIIVDLLRYKIL
ncbi:MAG: hypothetical protein C5S48_05640 [Candidatus Methanogaster sp.]|nr:MAG: hypothetical protein C5S48_05640 [ANME-2 cluster archaeon]